MGNFKKYHIIVLKNPKEALGILVRILNICAFINAMYIVMFPEICDKSGDRGILQCVVFRDILSSN